jgi:hypothetical protein
MGHIPDDDAKLPPISPPPQFLQPCSFPFRLNIRPVNGDAIAAIPSRPGKGKAEHRPALHQPSDLSRGRRLCRRYSLYNDFL